MIGRLSDEMLLGLRGLSSDGGLNSLGKRPADGGGGCSGGGGSGGPERK